jgi:hypothetical protein
MGAMGWRVWEFVGESAHVVLIYPEMFLDFLGL